MSALSKAHSRNMSRSEKWQLWDKMFGWEFKFKEPWISRHGVYYAKDIRCTIDDPDMPF